MSDDNPHRTDDKENGRDRNGDPTKNTEPLIVTIEPQTKNKHSYNAKHYRLDRARFRLEKKTYHTTHWTMIYLIVYTTLTLVVAVSSIFAVLASQKAAKAAKSAADTAAKQLKDFEASQAARLTIEDVKTELVREPSGGLSINVKYTLRNAGVTTAEHISSSGGGGTYDVMSPLPQCDLIKPSPESPHSILGGATSEELNIFGSFGSGVGDPNQVAAVESGKRRLFALSQISYFDVFGNPHTTSVCREYRGGKLQDFHICYATCK